MQKNAGLLIGLFILLLSTVPAHALQVVIDDSGTMLFYEDRVLGDEFDEDEEELPEKSPEPKREIQSESEQLLRIKPVGGKAEMSLQKRKKFGSEEGEELDADRAEVEFPSRLKKDSVELELEFDELENEDRAKAKEERQNRIEEKNMLRSTVSKDGMAQLELESRSVKAHSKGAEFVIDPETNVVTVITPSGQSHELTHLPDQAITRMKEAGLFEPSANESEVELELETREDGSVSYTTTVQKPKKIFGVFNREVETEVELDDATGTITERSVPKPTAFGRLLDSLAR